MGEAVNLLKSIRTTPPRVLTVTEMMNNYNGILLDSGATHILRQPYDEGEWNSAVPTEVQTATGNTQLRMAQNSNSLLTKDDLQPIVPLGMLTQYGCKMRWHRHRDGCALRHGKFGKVQVTVRDNCPYVFRCWTEAHTGVGGRRDGKKKGTQKLGAEQRRQQEGSLSRWIGWSRSFQRLQERC